MFDRQFELMGRLVDLGIDVSLCDIYESYVRTRCETWRVCR